MKLTKKIKKQNIKGIKDFLPVNLILFIGLKPLLGWWYFASLLEYISSENNNKINIRIMNEIWFAVFRSSNDSQELYIPVVNVFTLKNDTVPKSDKHSIATKANPAIIAGRADGKIIL